VILYDTGDLFFNRSGGFQEAAVGSDREKGAGLVDIHGTLFSYRYLRYHIAINIV
jgi:hypothetical protein